MRIGKGNKEVTNLKELYRRRIENRGITLVALIVTVVVLLILAGVSIGALTNRKGLIQEAHNSADQAQRESIIQKIQADLLVEKTKTGDNPNKNTLKDIIEENGYNEGELGEDSFITKDGEYEIQYSEILGWEDRIADVLEVGDYVEYDPTKLDAEGKQDVDSSKLQYVSEIGNVKEHGNGNSRQTFQATSNIKWKVFNIDQQTEKVELISEEIIKKNETANNGNFIMEGAIGYLYVEQELNEICKIFGYGYGADTSMEIEYEIGGPGEEEKGKITGSGARSIIVEDINKKAGIEDSEEAYKAINLNYGTKDRPINAVCYPTVNGNYATGESNIADKSNFKYTYYNYSSQKINDTDNLVFTGEYWIASRFVETLDTQVYFGVRCANSKDWIDGEHLSAGFQSWMNKYGSDYSYGVRPIVTLKSNMQVEKVSETEGRVTWKLK